MAGDPKECRVNAWRCAELAHQAKTQELKMTLIELSKNWLKLAIELERNQALMLDDLPVPKKSPKAARG
jgi:hypothetical protein